MHVVCTHLLQTHVMGGGAKRLFAARERLLNGISENITAGGFIPEPIVDDGMCDVTEDDVRIETSGACPLEVSHTREEQVAEQQQALLAMESELKHAPDDAVFVVTEMEMPTEDDVRLEASGTYPLGETHALEEQLAEQQQALLAMESELKNAPDEHAPDEHAPDEHAPDDAVFVVTEMEMPTEDDVRLEASGTYPLGETHALEEQLAEQQQALLAMETEGAQFDFSELHSGVSKRREDDESDGADNMLYDPVLNAFYDPVAGKFYRVKK